VTKTLQRISKVFYWPGLRADVIKYVRTCQACQRAKPAQNTRVGFHNSKVVTKPLERIFFIFVGSLVYCGIGNVAVLVVLDGFFEFCIRVSSE
jgi:hypothetical protein